MGLVQQEEGILQPLDQLLNENGGFYLLEV